MNAADVVIGIILVVGIVSGLVRGFVRGLLGLVGLVVGVMLAAGYYEWLADNALGFVPSAHVANVASFLLIFLVVVLVIGALGSLISNAIKLTSLRWLDRLAGGFLGFVAASVFASVLLLLAVLAGMGSEETLLRSTLAPRVVGVTHVVVRLLPVDVRERIDRVYDELRMGWRRPPPAPSDGRVVDGGPAGRPRAGVPGSRGGARAA